MSKIQNYKKVGSMKIKSGKIDITDPCYDKDVWCRMDGVSVKPGEYNCYVLLKGRKYKSVYAMAITHVDADLTEPICIDDLHYAGSVGVDAGLMSITEAGTKPDYTDEQWEKFVDALQSGPIYIVSNELMFNLNATMFVATSGDGDGDYPVGVLNSHNPSDKEATPDIIYILFKEEE